MSVQVCDFPSYPTGYLVDGSTRVLGKTRRKGKGGISPAAAGGFFWRE